MMKLVEKVLLGCFVIGLFAGPAAAVVQDKAQQKCINGVNKAGSKVAATQGKENASCVKNAGKNKLPSTAQECITADVKEKVAGAAQKTVDVVTDKCPTPPTIGFTGAAAVNEGAQAGEVDLLADVFGGDLDAAIIDCATSKDDCKCQSSVTKAVEKLAATKIKQFVKCKKGALGVGKLPVDAGAAEPADLALCVDDAGTEASIAGDGKEKLAKAISKLGDTITKSCADPVSSGAFPGLCDGLAGDALRDCLDERVNCRVCQTINAMDGLAVDCDAFDNGAADASCFAASVPVCVDDGDCGAGSCACVDADCTEMQCSAVDCGGCTFNSDNDGTCDGDVTGGIDLLGACSDGNPCNGEETCDGAGSCVAPTSLDLIAFSSGTPQVGGLLGDRATTSAACAAEADQLELCCNNGTVAVLAYTSDSIPSFPANYGVPSDVPMVGFATGGTLADDWADFSDGIFEQQRWRPAITSGVQQMWSGARRNGTVADNCDDFSSTTGTGRWTRSDQGLSFDWEVGSGSCSSSAIYACVCY